MMITHLLQDLRQRIPTWDTPSKVALISGVTLFPVMLIVGFWGPESIQVPARIGAFGLLLTIQLVILWGNRRMLSPYHEAQQHFLNGDYETACEILEKIPFKDASSMDALVLLGNTYRHLGRYDDSIAAINRALAYQPDYHFALFGMGKALLVTGKYGDASNFITKALSHGAPDVVQFDLGYAYYLQKDLERAAHHFNNILALIEDEPSQLLLARYCLYKMQMGERPSHRLIQSNLGYWQYEAHKHQDTPYGVALQSDIDTLTAWLKEN